MSTGTPTGTPGGAAGPQQTRRTPRAAGAAAARDAATPTTAQPTQAEPQRQSGRQAHQRQQKTGRVTSNKMQKTIVVAVESLKRHPVYKRTYKYTTKFKAHDEHNDARIGDIVRIEETRPLSKDKRWRLVEILKRAEQTVAPEVVEEQLERNEGLDTAAGVTGGTGR